MTHLVVVDNVLIDGEYSGIQLIGNTLVEGLGAAASPSDGNGGMGTIYDPIYNLLNEPIFETTP